MTKVIQIDGAPGTGKSYNLKQYLQEEKDAGLSAERAAWVTFTVAGRKDVMPDVADVFPNSDIDPDKIVRTMHGLSLSLLLRRGLMDLDPDAEGPGPIIVHGGSRDGETDPYQAFCEARGMRYDPQAANPRKLLAGEETTDHAGNKLFAINDFLRQTCKLRKVIDGEDPSRWRDAPVEIGLSTERIRALLSEWQEYKQNAFEYRLFEHGDYIDFAYQAGVTPDVDVLMVDEFQDFAPVEYRLYKMWRENGDIDRIYLAGDPNQSIYSFRGGTPHYFENTDTDDVKDLKESYRCPSEIAAVGNAVLSAHPATDPRGFAGRESGGEVTWPSITDKYTLRDAVIQAADRHTDADTSVMLLTRTNAHLRKLLSDLKDVGIPFEVLGRAGDVWQGDLPKMLAFLNNLKSDSNTFFLDHVRTVLGELPNSKARHKRLGTNIGKVIDRKAVLPAFDDFEDAVDVAKHLRINGWEGEHLVNAVDAPAAMNPQEVKAGTLHTSKGLEAPTVYLFTTTSEKITQQYWRDSDAAAEEHRVYYVGTTRASEELHLIRQYFEGPSAPPIRKVRNGGVA